MLNDCLEVAQSAHTPISPASSPPLFLGGVRLITNNKSSVFCFLLSVLTCYITIWTPTHLVTILCNQSPPLLVALFVAFHLTYFLPTVFLHLLLLPLQFLLLSVPSTLLCTFLDCYTFPSPFILHRLPCLKAEWQIDIETVTSSSPPPPPLHHILPLSSQAPDCEHFAVTPEESFLFLCDAHKLFSEAKGACTSHLLV